MLDQFDCEIRLRDHYERTAAIDHDGWMRPQSVSRIDRLAGMRVPLAKALIALATWMAPSIATPSTGTRATAH